MDSDDEFGHTNKEKYRIYINSDAPEMVQRETLFHELMHVSFIDCSLFKHPIESDDEQEEMVIRYSSPKLFQILRDNNELREFICG